MQGNSLCPLRNMRIQTRIAVWVHMGSIGCVCRGLLNPFQVPLSQSSPRGFVVFNRASQRDSSALVVRKYVHDAWLHNVYFRSDLGF